MGRTLGIFILLGALILGGSSASLGASGSTLLDQQQDTLAGIDELLTEYNDLGDALFLHQAIVMTMNHRQWLDENTAGSDCQVAIWYEFNREMEVLQDFLTAAYLIDSGTTGDAPDPDYWYNELNQWLNLNDGDYDIPSKCLPSPSGTTA